MFNLYCQLRVWTLGWVKCCTSPGLLIHIGDIHRRPRQAMLDGKATGFNEEASHTTLQHRIVPAEAHAEFPHHSLNKLLFGEEALTPISSQLPYVPHQAYQRLA
jgi:hypothetical protein